jgi:pilus assembly protein CpaC
VFVFGTGPGRTTIAALDAEGGVVAQIEVSVRRNGFIAAEAAGAVRRVLPNRNLVLSPTPNGMVMTGEVGSSAEAEAAAAIARGYLAEGQNLENRLAVRGGQQVNLRVRVAEVSREVTRQLGFNWQALGSIGRFGIAASLVNALADPTNLPDRVGFSYRGTPDINAFIDALAQDRLITILAEPNLTAMSGETASFLAGGEFPIPVSQRDAQVTIEFKQYGVSLAFVPTVSATDRITLRVRPEVSELSEQGAVRLTLGTQGGLTIPALTVRRAETTVELGSGQSFAIAGLLSDSNRMVGRGLPGVGEVPILGALFRSDRYQRSETELVIIITPYLVRPTSTVAALAAPTQGFRPANDLERILFMRQRARGLAPPAGRIAGDAGFLLD